MVATDLSAKNKFVFILVFLIAIFLRLTMSIYYFDISGDKIYQTAAAASIASGNGYTIPSVDPLNLDHVLDKPMILWPPLYSLLVAGLMKLNIDTVTASFLLDSLVNILFLVLIYRICVRLNFPFWLSMLVLLFRATEINEIITSSTATDYMGIDLWLAIILLVANFLEKPQILTGTAFLLLNALTPWLRYASIPLAPVIPLFVVVAGIWSKDRVILRTGIAGTLIALFSVLFLLYFNYSRSGNFFFVLETTKGFFPENLLQIPPIAWTSIINVNFPLTQISLRTGIYYGDLNVLLKITSALLLILLLYYIMKTTNWRQLKEKPNHVMLLLATLSLATLGSLAILSITRSRNYQVDRFWTYIEDNRYVLVVTTTLMFYFLHEFVVKRKIKLLGSLLIFLLTAETAHGVWVMAKRPLHWPGEGTYNSGSPLTGQLLLDRHAVALKENRELILVDEDYNLRGYAVLNNIRIMDDPTDLNKTIYTAAGHKRFFFRMPPTHSSLYKGFFLQPGVHEIGRLENSVFFELDIPQK